MASRLSATARLWWRMMRMQRVTREGWFYIGFTLVVGAAAINTGNNLLYLVLGLQLSLILLSAMLSESALRGVEVLRELPRNAVAGKPFTVSLVVRNRKKRFPSFSLLVSELDGPAAGVPTFVARVAPRDEERTAYRLTLQRRGVAAFEGVRITTRFPFGLFEKSRERRLPATLLVHPSGLQAASVRTLPVVGEGERPEPRPGSGHEYHALREFRPGDDPRSVHWKSTARSNRLLVVERERDRRRSVTLLVDGRGFKKEEDLDAAAESAIALSRRYLGQGCEVGLAWSGGSLPPASGPAQLKRLGDAAAMLGPAPSASPAPRPARGSQPVVIPVTPAGKAAAKETEAETVIDVAGKDGGGTLTLHGMHRAALLAAVSAAFGSLAISGELPLWASLGFAASALLGLAVREGAAQGLRNTSNLIAVGALLILTVQVMLGQTDVIVAAPTFAVALAASRLLGRRGPADDALLLLAALLMLAGGAALTGDLAYGVCFVAFAATSTVALCLSHLRREVEAVEGPAASHRKGTVRAALVGALALLSVAVLAGSALVFVGFPRISAGVIRRAMHHQVGGGADRIQLGGVGVLKDDPTPVLRVAFPEGEPMGELYWRTMVFDRWDGRGWNRPQTQRRPLAEESGLYRLAEKKGKTAVVADVEILGSEPGLPMPGDPIEVKFERKPGLPAPLLLDGGDGNLEYRGSPPIKYRLQAGPRPRDGELESLGRGYPPDLARYLELPEFLDPRVRELGLSFAASGDPLQIARAIADTLEKDFAYTRELPGEVADPLAHFLFVRKAGHCEFFASALTMLLRVNGIPARVAAGYYGASFVEGGDYWVVRQGDAHAWTEAYFPGRGWVRFDATPGESRAGYTQGFYAALVETIDVLRVRWSNWVLDFDGRSQLEIATAITNAFSREAAGRRLAPLARYSVATIAIVAAIWIALRLRTRFRFEGLRRFPPHQRMAIDLYRDVKKLLALQGVSLSESATSNEWAEAAAVVPDKTVVIRAALRAYESTRFGNRAISREELRKLRKALRI